MALREELLKIPRVGPTLADKIVEVVDVETDKRLAAMDEAMELVEDTFGSFTSVPTPLVEAIRASKKGHNPSNGCPFCGVDGCQDTCVAWNV